MASSSSSTPNFSYNVFLNFHGEDTRKSFVDHLSHAFKQKGISYFIDDQIEPGKHILQELLKAIQQSQNAVAVISENYAFSTWCLKELAMILECRTETGLKILPVFYHVDPSNVRKQKGSFEQAFATHEVIPEEQKKAWKTALNNVGEIAGWHIDKSVYESKVVEQICQKILDDLTSGSRQAGTPGHQRPHEAATPEKQRPHKAETPEHRRQHEAATPAQQRPHQAATLAHQRPHQAATPAQQRPHQAATTAHQRPHQVAHALLELLRNTFTQMPPGVGVHPFAAGQWMR